MTKFRIPGAQPQKADSPEQVFHSLVHPGVQHLWSQQADTLRAYDKVKAQKNVALELPTGSGKTLIGLLIAEYRRASLGERVAFACPTRQLAAQVHRHAQGYGTATVLLTGDHHRWDPNDLAAYTTGRATAVTTTSTIFNSSPKLEGVRTLIVDDAHAAEGFIASLFTTQVIRSEEPSVFDGLLQVFGDALPDGLLHEIREHGAGGVAGKGCGMIYPSLLATRADALRQVMAGLTGKARFAWSMVSNHVAGCLLYVSSDEINLRPLIPPSETHTPFASVEHRVFMSATLGNAGDLERSTGVRNIVRLPPPEGWQKKSTGRRLILFPPLSLVAGDCDEVAARFGSGCDRLLVLTTSEKRKLAIEAGWLRRTGKNAMSASQVEDDLARFTGSTGVALVLTNRYDGIDLPGDACRHMVLDGLPDATNLQEQFFSERLGARALLRERVRTRLSQALGRCTRGDGDFATVLVTDALLSNYFCDRSVQEALHPEIHAEVEFGVENSLELDVEQFLSLAAAFQTSEWSNAEAHLVARREQLSVNVDPVARKLSEIVGEELEYAYHAWFGDWEKAWLSAQKVTEALEGGEPLKPYRALWHLLTASAAENAGAPPSKVKELAASAVRCAPALRFFLSVQHSPISPDEQAASVTSLQGSNAAKALLQLGLKGGRFAKEFGQVLTDLKGDKARPFEGALDKLGEILGFEVSRGISQEKAAPDSIWQLGAELVLVFEAKNEEGAEKPMSTANLREAAGHEAWVRNRLNLQQSTPVVTVMVSPRTTRDLSSEPFAKQLRYASVAEMVALAEKVQQALTGVRLRHAEGGDGLEEAISSKLREQGLSSEALLLQFKPLAELPATK